MSKIRKSLQSGVGKRTTQSEIRDSEKEIQIPNSRNPNSGVECELQRVESGVHRFHGILGVDLGVQEIHPRIEWDESGTEGVEPGIR